MIKLTINLLILFLLTSCQVTNTKKITNYVKEKKENIKENLITKNNNKSQNNTLVLVMFCH